MKTKVILKRVKIRLWDIDENGNIYYQDFKRKSKIVFNPFAQNKRGRVRIYVK